jgi:hypothetical protein
MQTNVIFVLLELAGVSLVAHLVLSQLLRVLIQSRSPLAMELFAIPNAPIAPNWGFRLLRAEYFWPWRPQPSAMRAQPLRVRLIFWSARLTGAATPALMLAFFGAAFYIGTHDA